MKKIKRYLIGVLAFLLVLTPVAGITGCGSKAQENAVRSKENGQESKEEKYTFTDSAGRTVELPEEITKIAPSGTVAQVILYSLCPELMCGVAQDFPYYAQEMIDEKYENLPKFGQLYGSNANLNKETLIEAGPDVVIDMGEKKDTIKEDLDALQEQLGIPVIFIEAQLSTMSQAYETLGELGINPEQAKILADYCEETLSYADQQSAEIAEGERKTAYLAMGNDGLTTTIKNSIHADVLERVGVENVVSPDVLSGRTGTISFEQLLLWQPDYILADSTRLTEMIKEDSLWQELDAVKEGRVYTIPYNPYSFMNSPPSVNRMVGIWWIGNLFYPDKYQEDVNEKVKEFYQLFYHTDLTKEMCEKVLEGSW